MKNKEDSKRDYYFDNLKTLLIFLVVLGHFLLPLYYVSDTAVVSVNFIYIFHMPLFVFVTGYFSKKSNKNPFIWFFIPYVIFSTLYGIISLRSLTINPLIPNFAYWYLLSVVFWKLGASKLNEIKWIIPITIFLSIFINILPGLSNFLSFSRTITYLPFFLIGYKFKREWISKIKNISLPLILILFFIGLLIFYFALKYDLIYYDLLLRNLNFEGLGISKLKGVFVNGILIFPLTVIFSIVILYFVPEKKNIFSYIGKNTIIIFLIHPFIYYFLPHILQIINEYCGLSYNLQLILIFLSSVLITLILGFNLFTKLYNKGLKKAEKLLLNNNSQI